MLKTFTKTLLIIVYIILIGELTFRVISKFIVISEIEKLKYALYSLKKSKNPILDKEHVTNQNINLMGVKLKFNSLGNRNSDLINPKSENEIRIHIVGSSLVMGWGVKQDNIFSSRLETKLNRFINNSSVNDISNVKIINSGVMNTNTEYHVESAIYNFKKIKPDIIILGYFIDDSKLLTKNKLMPILRYTYFLSFLYQKIKSYPFSGTLRDYYAKINDENGLGWKKTEEAIYKLKKFCKINNVRFVIILLPDFQDFSNKDRLEEIYLNVSNRINKINISTINTYESLKKKYENNSKSSWISKDDAHPNRKAHDVISNDILKFILEKNLLKKIN